MPLPVRSVCYYLSTPDRDAEWRNLDYTAYKLTKAVKGEPIKGYFTLRIGGVERRFEQSNAEAAVSAAAAALAKRVADMVTGPVVLVPVPNSHVVAGVTDFRMLKFAQLVAAHLGEHAEARPLLHWRQPMPRAHEGGPREARLLFPELVLSGAPDQRPHVLVDDVCTSGGHFVAAAAKLRHDGATVPLAVSVAQTTDVQHDKMFGSIDLELTHELLGDDPFPFF